MFGGVVCTSCFPSHAFRYPPTLQVYYQGQKLKMTQSQLRGMCLQISMRDLKRDGAYRPSKSIPVITVCSALMLRCFMVPDVFASFILRGPQSKAIVQIISPTWGRFSKWKGISRSTFFLQFCMQRDSSERSTAKQSCCFSFSPPLFQLS